MSVEECLGLGPMLEVAGRSWPQWVQRQPVLAQVSGPRAVREWAMSRPRGEAERMLQALGELGSSRGADVPEAAAVLAWALLPGVCRLAGRLAEGSAEPVDHLVASELWVQCRTWDGSRGARLVGGVMWAVRDAVSGACQEFCVSDGQR